MNLEILTLQQLDKLFRKIVKKNGKEYELNIWDTPGQTKFNSLGKHYYKECFVTILLYDIQSQRITRST